MLAYDMLMRFNEQQRTKNKAYNLVDLHTPRPAVTFFKISQTKLTLMKILLKYLRIHTIQ